LSWLSIIVHSRLMLEKIFQTIIEPQTLRRRITGGIYPGAVREAALQTQIDRRSFPKNCPYTLARCSIRTMSLTETGASAD
jgi:hypothetical protein